jgi:tetratricopeptide (TPR) repeat protein
MFNPDDEERPLLDQEYNEDMSQILNVYNDITKRISDEINVNLRPQEEKRLAESRTVDPDAYAAYLKGQENWERLSGESMPKALEYFQIAIEKDPDWAPPYAGLSLTYGVLGAFGFMPVTTALPKTYNYQNKAFDLDPNNAEAHFAAAITATWLEWDWEKGEREFLKSLDLYPSYALCRVYYAHLLLILNRYDEAIYHAEFAVETDPLSALVLSLYGQVLNVIGDPRSALKQGKKAISIDPDNSFAPGVLYFAYQRLGNYEEWFKLVKERSFSVYEQYGVAELLEKIFHEQGYFAFMEEAIRIHEEVLPKDHIMYEIDQAERYSEVKNFEKALDCYEKCYEDHYWELAYIYGFHKQYPELKDNPRYIALLKKMNLPLP